MMRYPDYRTIRGEGPAPLPGTRDPWLDRLSLWLAGETGLGMLIVAFALALFAAAIVWGMNVGYDMALVGMSQQAQEVLR
jgi:ABC-type uncharacterized transport system permease subunit